MPLQKPMTRRRTLIFTAIVVLLVCGSIIAINTRAFQARYHTWQMQRSWQQAFANPMPPTDDGLIGYTLGDAYKRYECHRQRLVELGCVAERHYHCKHLLVNSRECKNFSKLLVTRSCPNHIDFTSPCPDKPEPMQLTVWCYSEDATAWDDFVAEHDVADYRDRFMPGKEIAAKAGRYANQWAKLGMWLPSAKEVDYFSTNLEETQDILSQKLEDQESYVRQCAAYVAEKIGPKARLLKDSVLQALRKEKESIVRIYLCNALRGIGDNDKEVLAALRSLFSQKGDGLDSLTERIYAAAALFALSDDPAEKTTCRKYVCRWLQPPDATLSGAKLDDYWELRWSAVNAVEYMRGAKDAIPLLEAMLVEPSGKTWVGVHVPRALHALKNGPANAK